MSSTSDDSLPPPMQEPAGMPPAPPPALTAHNETLLAQLARDFLRERRLERRWRTVFRIFWLGLAALFVYSLWLQGRHVTPTASPHTALVEVRGEIAADTEAYLCGPPPMIDAALPLLGALGVSQQHMHFDKFLDGSHGLSRQDLD